MRSLWGLAQRRRCAVCWGPVVLRAHTRDDRPGEPDWRVECPQGCLPGGHVSAGSVERQRAADELQYLKVIANYPELGPRPLTADELRDIKSALWGEEGTHAHQGTD